MQLHRKWLILWLKIIYRTVSKNVFIRVFRFYYEGFTNMTVGRKLWAIIIIKLIVLFAVLKLFFFQDFLGSKFENDQERSDYVIEQLISPK
ncbi:MAG: DUF4492 domain-containing protein [Bacteroidetes bacterium HGW-Bacteroidetes-4]|jgi:hypothetical protein|nr:MAG: DUF4492 domain-containing protein [Bacteroidetes bacterium HGW-Bacteroidetes-4]